MSIVVAYAMSEVLSGFGQMIRMRDRVRPYPLQLGWSVLVVLLMVQWGLLAAFVLVSFRAG
jgi:ABC-type sulfate transport system permease component